MNRANRFHTLPPAEDDLEAYYDEKLGEIPPEFLRRAVAFLQRELPDEVKAQVRAAYARYGSQWIIKESQHFGWGVTVRNTLRECGLTDDHLPDQNWDDYYQQVVEVALGLREFPPAEVSG